MQTLDVVAHYGSALGWVLRPRTVIVEGSTDADLFKLAARLEREETGVDLLGCELAIVPAGEGDQGGTRAVIRELVCLRGLARTCLSHNGRPLYRFVGLFDNDNAGRRAVNAVRGFDASILEYKDVFRIRPIMPSMGNRDPKTLERSFDLNNGQYKGLDWELEDLLTEEFLLAFLEERPNAIEKTTCIGGRIHRDLTRDGKAQLHRFVKQHAIRRDLGAVIGVIQAIRFYMGLRPVATESSMRQSSAGC